MTYCLLLQSDAVLQEGGGEDCGAEHGGLGAVEGREELLAADDCLDRVYFQPLAHLKTAALTYQ